jgi:hypothetical protein
MIRAFFAKLILVTTFSGSEFLQLENLVVSFVGLKSLYVNAVKIGCFMLQFVLWDKSKNCNSGLIVVYSAAHDDMKMDFLTELAAFCRGMHCPYIVGGDF